MSEIIARCGYRCDLCLAYGPNIDASPANRAILSDGWHEYFGFRIPPEGIRCDGCLGDHPHLIDTECPVRPCVIEKRLDHCAACPAYGCEKLRERFVVYEEIAARRAVPIPPVDRDRFIRPYENRIRLDAMRRGEPRGRARRQAG